MSEGKGLMQQSLSLQRAIVAALEADPGLIAAGVRVHDGPPADARPPFVTLGPDMVVPWQWQGGGGEEHRLALTAWIGREGIASAKAVLANVSGAILGMPRTTEGLRIVTLRLLRGQVRRNPRSWTEGRLEFLARTMKEDN